MDKDYFSKRARELCAAKGMVCLVPRAGVSGISCHERTLCDCEVEAMLAKALSEGYERGRWAEITSRPLSGNAFDPRAQAIIESKDGGEE